MCSIQRRYLIVIIMLLAALPTHCLDRATSLPLPHVGRLLRLFCCYSFSVFLYAWDYALLPPHTLLTPHSSPVALLYIAPDCLQLLIALLLINVDNHATHTAHLPRFALHCAFCFPLRVFWYVARCVALPCGYYTCLCSLHTVPYVYLFNAFCFPMITTTILPTCS